MSAFAAQLAASQYSLKPISFNPYKEILKMTVKLTKKIGMLLLGIWLILKGLIPLFNLSFSGLGTVMALLVITAGVFILLER